MVQSPRVQAIPDVAKLYCDKLGLDFGNYTYKVVEEDAGERGICVLPNGQEVDAWNFFTGEVAQDYSYCAKKGYASEIDDGGAFSSEQQVCLVRDFDFLPATKVSVEDVANLDYKENEVISAAPPIAGGHLLAAGPPALGYDPRDFSYWDWRNPPESTKWSKDNYAFFDQINGWLTSIKDQGSCKACWSFGTMGSVESKYKINSNDSMLEPDLSEQYLVSSCCEDCGNCSGGSRYASFDYLVSHGVSDEQCFKYKGVDLGCTPCADQVSRLWTINNYIVSKYSGVDDLKQNIINNGPVTIIMDWAGGWDDCVYKCDGKHQDDGTHIVILAGYNDTGNPDTSYWIAKNSFGLSWPGKCNIGEGYFKLGFNTCNVGTIIYPKNVIAPDFKPTITLNSPPDKFVSEQQVVNFNFTVDTKVSKNKAKCYLVIDGIEEKEISVDDSVPSSVDYAPGLGKHTWRVDCWEDKIGIKNSSETRNFELDFQSVQGENGSTNVSLIVPPDHYLGLGNLTIRCEASDVRKVDNLSLYMNISGWTLIITNNFCDQNCFLEYSGFFSAGEYKWNCLAVGSQNAWADENFTFDILNGPGQQGGNNGSQNGSGNGFGGLLNGSGGIGNMSDIFGKTFESSRGTCQKSSRRCWSSSVLQQCIDGKWGNLNFCAYGCDPYQLKCRVCREGERACAQDGKNALICSDDSWKTQICPLGCDNDECMSGSQNTKERGFDISFLFIFGIPIIVLIVVGSIIILRRRNGMYLERNNRMMEAIKDEI